MSHFISLLGWYFNEWVFNLLLDLSPFQDIRAEAYEFLDNQVETLNDVNDVLNQPEVWNIKGGPNDLFHSGD